MPYSQAAHSLRLTTPLGTDVLLVRSVEGQEGISQLYRFEIDAIAEQSAQIDFERLLGQRLSVDLQLSGSSSRYFSGICNRVSAGGRDGLFQYFRLEMVPELWLLTRKAQSRIFQQKSVPDILKTVLEGLNVTWKIQATYQPRDYCVQYRETDFSFASRLMEEEGIFYFFVHSADGHRLVVADQPDAFPGLPGRATIEYEPKMEIGGRTPDTIQVWEKSQELRPGKYTLWDHSFELPHRHLEASELLQEGVQAGKVAHKLKIGRNDRLEVYDYPGEYAQRFDGIDPSGGDRAADLQRIFEDNARTVKLRMQEQAADALVIRGEGYCRELVSGHRFTFQGHHDADGPYVVTTVSHSARQAADYRSGGQDELDYSNRFTCIPAALPFRPRRSTPRPTIHGTQTAVVVGPAGDEIFTDKYSRVKVQFHWDRDGKNDSNSSCWVRVGTPWAGKNWGMIHIPRIGQEVIVAFEEGDPDRPIVVGSVYNADMMPPYALPANKTQSGVKSRSSLKGTPENYNEIRFEDKKGEEQLLIHAEKNQDIEVENDETHWVGHDRTKTIDHNETNHIKHDRTETVDNDESITIGSDRTETVGKNESITIGGRRTEQVGKDEIITIQGNRTESVGKDESIQIGANRQAIVKKNESLSVGDNRAVSISKSDTLDVGKSLVINAGDQITIQTGSASIVMKKNGDITIRGKNISIDASGKVSMKATGTMTLKGSKIAEN